MKTKSLFLGLGFFFSATLFGQQLGDGAALEIPNFNAPLSSGFYKTNEIQEGYPSHYAPEWMLNSRYLINVAAFGGHDPAHQFQISTPLAGDDRVFFRKLYPTTTSGWYEFATRGKNTFTGDQYLNGDVYLAEPNVTTKYGEYGKALSFGNYMENGQLWWLRRYNVAQDASEIRMCIGDNSNGKNKFSIGAMYYWSPNRDFSHIFTVVNNGYVGIWNDNPKYHLDVNGTIRAKEVRVETDGADFVFDKSYTLPTLEEVKAHIDEFKHLPGVPSESEMKQNGVGVSEISTKLLQKVEELTLYVIQQNEKAAEQQKTISELNNRIKDLEKSKK